MGGTASAGMRGRPFTEGVEVRAMLLNAACQCRPTTPITAPAYFGAFTPTGTPTFMALGGTPDEALILEFATRANPVSGTTMNVPNVIGNFGFMFAYPASLPAPASVTNQLGTDVLSTLSTATVTVDGTLYQVYWSRPAVPVTTPTAGHTLTIG